ncbi:MAG: glycine betaine ABC transporter substrate-binding protein [Lachnospiraceae bacterium]|jgi:osmoprotectant transport system substrate-binding protein
MLKRFISISLAVVFAVSALVGCGGSGGSEATKIAVGSKDFTESFILAELYALALEKEGFEVERKFNLGGTNVTQPAMVEGDLDVYPEYTGTCLLNVLQEDMMTDPQEVYDHVKSEYEEQFNLTLLNPAEASNSQGLAISAAVSEKYNIKTISDLQANASEVRFASQGAFEENADGMPALINTYGEFAFKSVEYFDNAIKYELINNDEADLIIAFTTDGQLTDPSMVLLEDDKKAWPPYNIVPVIRQDTLEKDEKIAEALNAVSAVLDNETMQKLNAEVDINKREPEEVAKEFFDATF